MNRLPLVLTAVSGILAGALGYSVLNQPKPVTDEAAVRAIVEEVLAQQAPVVAEPRPSGADGARLIRPCSIR